MGGFFNATTAPTGGDPNHVKRSRVPDGQCYVPHEGRAAKLRRLTQRTRHLTLTIEQEFRLNVWLKTAPGIVGVVAPGYARMLVLGYARCQSEDMGLPVADVLDCVLDKLEGEQSAATIREFLR